MTPVRILFTIPNFITAGSGRAMLNVIERLDRQRYQPAVCVARLGGALCAEVERLGVPLLEAPFTVAPRPLRSLLQRARDCARIFRPYRFDLWHSFHYSDDYTEPLIARLAGARAWVYTKKNMSWRSRAWYARTALATRVAAQNTTMLRQFFPGRWFRSKTWLVPPGVDHILYAPVTEKRLRLREANGLAPTDIVAGIVAHLVPVKGHPELLRAVAKVPGLHLWIAGNPLDAAYAAQLQRLVAELRIEERVRFLGAISDIPALLAELDIFVLSSVARGEGCPVALMEAMSAGLACIATNVPGCNDLIEDGVHGLLTPAGDVDALAAALERLASSEDLRRKLGSEARRRIEQHYTLAREARSYDALYQSALGIRA